MFPATVFIACPIWSWACIAFWGPESYSRIPQNRPINQQGAEFTPRLPTVSGVENYIRCFLFERLMKILLNIRSTAHTQNERGEDDKRHDSVPFTLPALFPFRGFKRFIPERRIPNNTFDSSQSLEELGLGPEPCKVFFWNVHWRRSTISGIYKFP